MSLSTPSKRDHVPKLPLLSCPVAKLPQETLDQIIDHVASSYNHLEFLVRRNTNVLLACALTCRAWRDRSVFHLRANKHRSVWVAESRNALDEVTQQYGCRPDLATFTQKLTIEGMHVEPMRFYDSECRRLLDIFPNVHEVTLCNVIAPPPVMRWTTFHRQYLNVTSLHLDAVQLPTCRYFAALLHSFPHLEALHLTEAFWQCDGHQCVDEREQSDGVSVTAHSLTFVDQDDDVGCGENVSRPRLRELSMVRSNGHMHELRCLPYFFDLRFLIRLRVSCPADATGCLVNMNDPTVSSIVTEAGDSLENASFIIPAILPSAISLRSNTSFSTLRIGWVDLRCLPQRVPDFSWIPTMLSAIVSTRFQRFYLHIKADSADQLQYVEWARIDDILSGPVFSCLEAFEILYRGMYHVLTTANHPASAVIEQLMPKLVARNVLIVSETIE
ncbi:unnamed protein product [Somion occarium]|uniref:F-box domain-containing protein n=1 Tax=Somion occarium TaxID=3059160 RepID=A0ABP1D277_9APHY